MDINVIQIFFTLISIFIGFVGLLVNFVEPYLPIHLTSIFRYGKFAVKNSPILIAKFEVPKCWYRHFYIFAAPLSTFTLTLIFYKYFLNGNIPNILFWLLDVSFGTSRKPLASPEDVTVATVLITVQCWKRFYETQYVSVFSNNKMNVSHYMLGYIHYWGTMMCLLAESHGFIKGSNESFSWEKLSLLHLVCTISFLWATTTQLKANFVLANLRRDGTGSVVYTGYKIPNDGLFKYVSGALQFTEILLYVILSIILWRTSTFHYITFFVLVNQIECAMLSHWWYQQTFKNYPKERKILIPYVF